MISGKTPNFLKPQNAPSLFLNLVEVLGHIVLLLEMLIDKTVKTSG